MQRVLETSAADAASCRNTACASEHSRPANYFAALKSPRRREVIREVNLALIAAADATLHDRLADIPELARYECFAQTGTGTRRPRMIPGTRERRWRWAISTA